MPTKKPTSTVETKLDFLAEELQKVAVKVDRLQEEVSSLREQGAEFRAAVKASAEDREAIHEEVESMKRDATNVERKLDEFYTFAKAVAVVWSLVGAILMIGGGYWAHMVTAHVLGGK
jgi:outer membrane murein-binding lipoprotein Lpp